VIKKFARKVFLLAQALATSPSLVPLPKHDLPAYKRFLRSLVLSCAKEYF
jgi:hypothetical protein